LRAICMVAEIFVGLADDPAAACATISGR